jgi:acyl carrier protein
MPAARNDPVQQARHRREMTTEAIQQTLIHEIQTLLGLKPGSVTPDTALPTLGIDSLKFVSLVLAIEKHCGVNLMKKGLKPADMASVRAMADVIQARRSA